MQIKYNFFITALIVLLITILNVLFLCALNLIAPLLIDNFSIYNNFLIYLVIAAIGVSIISYYLTNHLSFNYTIIQEKDDIENKLKKALQDINISNIEMRREIDDRKKIEKSLIDSEMQVRTIINKAPTGIALLDKEGWILECNHALQDMLDYNEDELSGVLLVQAIHPQVIFIESIAATYTKNFGKYGVLLLPPLSGMRQGNSNLSLLWWKTLPPNGRRKRKLLITRDNSNL